MQPLEIITLIRYTMDRSNDSFYTNDGRYDTAPAIVEQINKQPDRAEIYRHLNECYLSKCLAYIEKGENEKCKDLYIAMMDYLQEEKGKWVP